MIYKLLKFIFITKLFSFNTNAQPILLPNLRNGTLGSPGLLRKIKKFNYTTPQYYNNSKWINIDIKNIDYYNLYNSLLNYKTSEIRLNNNSDILNFRLAYTKLDVTINNTFMYIYWDNINFIDNNSLYIDFFF